MKELITTLRDALFAGAIEGYYRTALSDQLAAWDALPPPASPLPWRVTVTHKGFVVIRAANDAEVATCMRYTDAAYIVAAANAGAAATRKDGGA